MIFLLLAFHYLCGIASSAQTTYTSTTTVEAEEWTHIYVYTTNFRSTAEIVTSCISTILLCTWFTIHPDVCGYRSTWMQRTGRKLELFLWALLAPELIVMWACNQWVGARRIRDEMGPGCNWTTVEAHLLQMRGILFFHDGKSEKLCLDAVLSPSTDRCYGPVNLEQSLGHYDAMRRELKHLHKIITRDEITDRSKSDALSKTIVIIQTTWFTLQCVARGVKGLAITELEIVTLAYTALNGVMCFFWWRKPLDVQCPVLIELNGTGVWGQIDQDERHPEGNSSATPGLPASNSPVKERWSQLKIHVPSARFLLKLLYRAPVKVLAYLYVSMSMLNGFDEIREDCHFNCYTNAQGSAYYLSTFSVSCLASLFGAIHCTSWSFPFPGDTLRALWRACSIFITFSPLVLPILPPLYWYSMNRRLRDRRWDYWIHPEEASVLDRLTMILIVIDGLVIPPLYITARIILLVVAFVSLSTIPATGHQSIEWSDFIPHI